MSALPLARRLARWLAHAAGLLGLVAITAHAAVDLVMNLDDNPANGGGPDPVVAGGVVTYNVRVNNDDPIGNATNVVVTFTLPASGSLVGVTGAICSGPVAGVLTCPLGAIAADGSAAFQVRVRPNASALVVPTITVSASVSSPEVDTQPGNNAATQDTTVNVGANLAIAKVGNPSPVQAGATLQYTLTATNNGPDSASALVVVDTLPPSFVRTGALPAGCNQVGQVVTCNIAGPLASGAQTIIGPISGRVTAAGGSTLTNAVTVSSAVADPVPADNTATLNTTVLPGSDVALAKSSSPSGGTVTIGGNVNFTLTPTYSGDPPVNLTLTDTIPAAYQITNAASFTQNGWGCTVAGQAVSCTRASGGAAAGNNVAIGAVTINTIAIAAANAVVNTATITTTSSDPNAANNSASSPAQNVVTPSSDLRANKTGPSPALAVVGQSFNWTLSFTNLGPSPFSGEARLVDTVPAGVTVSGYTLNGWTCTPAAPFVGAPTDVTCTRVYTTAAPLAVNATTPTVVLAASAATAGLYSNTVCAGSAVSGVIVPPVDNNAGNNCAGHAVTVQDNPTSADLSLGKAAAPDPVAAGSVLTYTIEVRNAGPGTAGSVTVTDTLGTLFTSAANPGFVGASATGGGVCTPATAQNVASTNLSCTFASVAACTSGVDCPLITVQVRPGGNGGARGNTASVISNATADPNLGNNSVTINSTVDPRADMTVTKTASPATVPIGQNVTYVVTARNIGPSQAAAVSIADTLPLGAAFVSATPSTGSCPTAPGAGATITAGNQTLACNLGAINAGAQQTVTIVVRPTLANSLATVPNAVSVATTTAELDLTNNSASASANVSPPTHDILVNKTDAPDPVARGDSVVYTIRVTNNGPSFATGIVVTDSLPAAGLSFQSVDVSGIPGASCSSVPAVDSFGGTLVCNVGDIAVGSNRAFTVTLRGDVKGVYTNAVASVQSQEMLALGNSVDGNLANNAVIEATTVRTRSDLQATSKTALPPSNGFRRPFTYTAVFTNLGSSEADDIVISDALPAGMELTGAPTLAVTTGSTTLSSCTGAAGGTSFACSLGTMSFPGAVQVTIPVRVISFPAGGTITNTISIATSSIDPTPGNNATTGAATITASSLAGTVYRDLNDNGAIDAGETGIAGITVTLTGTAFDGTPISRTTTSAANGTYSFANLPAGTYAVAEGAVALAGFIDGRETAGSAGGSTATNDQITGITLGDNTTASAYNFGEIPEAAISGRVFHDINANGSFDGADAGIAAVTLTLTGTDDLGAPVTRTTTSAANGSYAFSGLRPGTYTLAETQPATYLPGRTTAGTVTGTGSTAGSVQGGATGNVIQAIVLGVGGTSPNNNFGEVRASSIAGTVYIDGNNNGAVNAGEPGIAGVAVALTGTDFLGNAVSLTTTTAANGSYQFASLLPGSYTVTETQPVRYADGIDTAGSAGGNTSTNDVIAAIALNSEVAATGYDFGERGHSLAGVVYEDVNDNGVRDPGELPIPGVTVQLAGTDAAGNPVTATVVSGADGSYAFANLPASNAAGYTVTETQPAAYSPGKASAGSGGGTAAGSGNVISGVVIGASATPVNLTGYLFGELSPVGISGRVFEDRNGNGLVDLGDTGIAGVTITLTGTTTLGAPVTLVTTTDGAGNYSFATLAPGTYTVTETQPAGYLPGRTTAGTVSGPGSVAGSVSGGPTGNVIQTIVLGSGGGSPNNNFAEVREASIAGRVYLDGNANDALDPGESGIAAVTVTLSGTDFLGNPVSRSMATDAGGGFAFGSLLPGTYTLTETQPIQFLDGATAAGSTGGTVAPNVVSAIALPSGAAGVDYLFGERGAGGFELRGRVYYDINGNGVRDASDPAIAGVAITLTGVDLNGNPVSRSAVSAADGSYAFVGLAASNAAGYTLTESQPLGYSPGAANPGSVGGTAGGGGNVISGIRLDNALTPSAIEYDFGEIRQQAAIPTLQDALLAVLSALLLFAGARRIRHRR